MTDPEQGGLVRRYFAAAGLTAALLAPADAIGASAADYPARDMALLPPYCKYEPVIRDNVPGGQDPVQTQKWQSILGYMWQHLHHYCWGLQQTNYAMLFAPNEHERKAYLQYSLPNFDYVIKYMKPDYVLLPEVLTKKGENLIRLGRAAEAMAPLQRAIEVKPDYWPPYAALADYYKEAGAPAKAREWLEKGLAAAPGTPALTRRLTELGGAKSTSGTSTK